VPSKSKALPIFPLAQVAPLTVPLLPMPELSLAVVPEVSSNFQYPTMGVTVPVEVPLLDPWLESPAKDAVIVTEV
jgi:hypothetical protein